MLALEWLKNAHGIMEKLEATQLENIKKAATAMADSIEAGRWVHTFGCGHATIPVEEMYPRIGSFVGFHPLCELPLTFFTQIIGPVFDARKWTDVHILSNFGTFCNGC